MIIRVEGLSKSFNDISVLNNINLEFQSGKIYGIVGSNGSGKTMLLRAISGLIIPSEGQVEIDGKVLHKELSFPENMGLLIEKPELLNYLTGFENLKFLASIKHIISDEKIREYMQKFMLEPDSKKTVKKYSLGMKQKLGIIQAIMENQELLILDEPFNALDEATVQMLRKMFLEYKKTGKLLIITSHNAEDIEVLCDRVIHLCEGKVVR